jgi:hypothetical protein
MGGKDFSGIFAALKLALSAQASRLAVKTDAPNEYALVTKSPSPYPQHKGQPMWFGAVKIGKAYVSYHLMPLYMNAPLAKTISPGLKKHMQGKSCFNFKVPPQAEAIEELRRLTAAAADHWARHKLL